MDRGRQVNPLELRIFEKHPHADAYKVGPSYAPYALVARANRFTDAELAAEWHKQDNHCGQKLEGYRVAHNGDPLGSEEEETERLLILYRFATLPHFDGAS